MGIPVKIYSNKVYLSTDMILIYECYIIHIAYPLQKKHHAYENTGSTLFNYNRVIIEYWKNYLIRSENL